MKTRLLIIIGIIMLSTIPFATFAVLDRYENYVEQLQYESQRIANEPKPEPEPELTPNDTSGKRIKVEGEIAEQICEIMDGGCPSYYIGNIQDDGSIMVGITISQPSGETFHLFFINDGVLSHEVRENEN